jgi:PAS domain S-box
LPDGDGLELIEGAKRVNGTKIPVIVLTAYGTEEIAVHSLKSGAMDYVVKSAERFKELPWIVERTLREWGCILERKEANEYISAIFAAAPDPLCDLDLNGIRIDCNPAMEEITGLSREELIGKPAYITFTEGKEECERALEEVIRTGHAHYLERTILTKDGERIPVSAHARVRRDADGNAIGAIVALRDVRELKRREEELEDRNRFITEVIGNIPDPLAIIDKDNRVIQVNDGWKRVLGYEREELLNRRIVDLPTILAEQRKGLEEHMGEEMEKVA